MVLYIPETCHTSYIDSEGLDVAEAGLGSKVWESSLALACWALMNPAAVSQRRVLELGSGCGFGGVMLAAAGAGSVRLPNSAQHK
jgi:predicted nicotinamide N-methyase